MIHMKISANSAFATLQKRSSLMTYDHHIESLLSSTAAL